MLKIEIKGAEFYDERTNLFAEVKDTILQLEHSLISISKWESKWHKPFLMTSEMSGEEILDYIRCMTITQNVDPRVYDMLTDQNIIEIRDYMNDPMTATWFNDQKGPKGRQRIVTSELIYYWMTALQIPFECEKWHINRLLTLIRVCNIENAPKKKMRRGDIYKQNAALNEQRRRMMHTTG